jgi:hypothetical protein
MIRHHKFASLTRPRSPYAQLLNDEELPLLPLLREFQQVGRPLPPCTRCCRGWGAGGARGGAALRGGRRISATCFFACTWPVMTS